MPHASREEYNEREDAAERESLSSGSSDCSSSAELIERIAALESRIQKHRQEDTAIRNEACRLYRSSLKLDASDGLRHRAIELCEETVGPFTRKVALPLKYVPDGLQVGGRFEGMRVLAISKTDFVATLTLKDPSRRQ